MTIRPQESGRSLAGYTLLELMVVVVVIGLVMSLAVPSVRGEMDRLRVDAALNRVVGELYRARMTAVESGAPARLVFHRGAAGCVERMSVVTLADAQERALSGELFLPGLCMQHSGDSVLTFDSRGMLKPPARSFHVRYGSRADSVVLSIAGRIRRSN
ncbi:MAG: prepilin-type N-terminal cleavage/methylation domain-containing protein [Gemmatimonadota bacterium]|jgi:prepilin-type N-terminal cleavage/methylation domain-containing protein|nr:prepilin-type N-terminal cleavage/methylation domain-containing protein [Gemmatimonadota bacterium]